MKSFRIVVLSVVVLIFFVFLSFSYSQNKIAVVEGEQIKLFEYNALEEKYEQIWESIERREKRNRRGWHFSEPIIMDFDKDGKNELIAMDEFGLYIWGKHGKYPEYYNFQEAYVERDYQLIVADVDYDSSYEIITQGSYNRDNRKVTIWKFIDNSLKNISSIDLPYATSWSIRWGDCDGDGIGEFVSSSTVIHIYGLSSSKIAAEVLIETMNNNSSLDSYTKLLKSKILVHTKFSRITANLFYNSQKFGYYQMVRNKLMNYFYAELIHGKITQRQCYFYTMAALPISFFAPKLKDRPFSEIGLMNQEDECN